MVRKICLLPLSDVPHARGVHCRVEGLDLAVFRVGDAVYALNDSCPHQGASLANGQLHGCVISCPAHGLKFDVRTGCSTVSPELRTRHYPLHVENGMAVLACDD